MAQRPLQVEVKLKNTIQSLRDWDQLAIFEKNARERNGLTQEVTEALKSKAIELAKQLVVEKAKIDLNNLSAAEEKIVHVLAEFVGIRKRQRKSPERTFLQLKNRGLLGAAEAAVCKAEPTAGFQTLQEEGREELSYEQIVVDHEEEFSPRAVWYARRTLELQNASDKPPADRAGKVQERTGLLLTWLQNQAIGNGGLLPNFTNEQAALLMGIADTQSFGRALGNIQSRIDYACFKCQLPPLGLAADKPYAQAWQQQDRSWPFPIEDMANASRTRTWTEGDFHTLARTCEQLEGQAHPLWRNALENHEQEVRDWAFGLAARIANTEQGPNSEENIKVQNPKWLRDELILALDLYMKHRSSPPGKHSDEVADLSRLLNRLGQALGRSTNVTYRNYNGVYMKLMNFRSIDPDYTKDGRVGLQRRNKDEMVVWELFANNRGALQNAAHCIIQSLEVQISESQPLQIDEPEISEAREGRLLTRVHRTRERSRKLVEAKKKQFLAEHGSLQCEACGFRFSDKYGEYGNGIIDCHHTRPVSTLTPGHKTKVEDLALLCANCHRIVHARSPWLSIEEVRALITDGA